MSLSPLPMDDVRKGLAHFGLRDFRPGQAEVVQSVLAGRNVVVVMPTGAGKSLCYQLPATLLPGVTLVVSPLIALMKDQVEQLTARGISAAFINSTLTELERADRLRRLRSGEYRLVYVAPERFRSAAFLEALAEARVALFAIDEAHCISQWGHDFRPDYAWLGQVRKRLRPPRTVALTATATPEVRDDIVRTLLLKDPEVFVAGFDRPNLFLEVAHVGGEEERRAACARIAGEGGSGLVYCATRKSAEAAHQALQRKGLSPVLYHAGMDEEARRRAQDTFMGGQDAVAVATNAFGMGIDKPDIRFVVHANMPRAVEAYYQEIGRAGRDGRPARAVLLFCHSDVYTQERMIQGSAPSEAVFSDLWNLISQLQEFDEGVGALAGQLGASEFEISAALRILEREGKIARGGRGEGTHGICVTERADAAQPHAEDSRRLLAALRSQFPVGQQASVDLPSLGLRASLTVPEVRHALSLLERAGAVQVRRPFAGKPIRALSQVPFSELGLNLSSVREQERQGLLLLKRMTDYAYTRRCRRAFLLRYFGEGEAPGRCESCDVCKGATLASFKDEHASAARAAPQAHSALAALELRRWRTELSRDLGIPPFIIFNDRTLFELATVLPTDRESFLTVKGTGESRWERFGPKVREISLLARAAGHTPGVPTPRTRRRR